MTLILLVRLCKGELGRSLSTIVVKNVNLNTKKRDKMSPRFLWYGAKSGVGYFVLFCPIINYINRGFRGPPRQISPQLPSMRETST